MVLGKRFQSQSSESAGDGALATRAMLRVFPRLLHAVNFFVVPDSLESHQRRRVRLSRSGAVLVGFLIFHSFPNVLLLTKRGRARYSHYGKYHSTSTVTKLIELFLLSGGATHGILSVKSAWDRLRSEDANHPHTHLNEMLITGSVIFFLLVMHLFDFRFDLNEDERHLDAQVLELLDKRYRRFKNTLYWSFIISVYVHAWRGCSKAWLFRLGFREEIPVLHKLCRFLLLVSGVLYTIPLVMDNPYSQDPDSPVRGPRIISVD
jgi:hypothetical protein